MPQRSKNDSVQDLLHNAAQHAAEQRLTQQLEHLLWQESQWLVKPAASLQRLLADCQMRRQYNDISNHHDTAQNDVCLALLQKRLQHDWAISDDHITALLQYHEPADFELFSQQHSVADFDSPLAFFEAFWQQQDDVYGATVSQALFTPQRERLRLQHRIEEYIETSQAPSEQRLNWYQQQIDAYQQRFGKPPYQETRDHVHRLIALQQDPQRSDADELALRFQLRQQWLGADRAEQWQQREQQFLARNGQLPPL
ncbi:hypothetical protein [Bacterioplanes sanyensis]|nr:hypothetical protein [Bacterioplanes sanyensis]